MENLVSGSLSPNHLQLYRNDGSVDVNKTADLLEVSRTELAEAFGLTPNQIRPDRLTGVARQRFEQLAGALENVAALLDGDVEKTQFWLRTPNRNFGGTSPKNLILSGLYDRVVEFVEKAQREQQQGT